MYSNGSTKMGDMANFRSSPTKALAGYEIRSEPQNWSNMVTLIMVNWATSSEFQGLSVLNGIQRDANWSFSNEERIFGKSGDLRENQFENVSPDITSMYDFNVVSNEDEQSFSFNYKNQNQQGTWGNVYIVATQVNRPLPKQIIVTAITMMEDVKGGNSQSVGIMVTQLELKSSFP